MKNCKFLWVAVIAVALSSCAGFGGKQTPSFQLSDLQGLWVENGDTVKGHYVRFTTEQSNETGYLYGREWTLAEDVKEEDLYVYVKDSQGKDSLVRGNGWFKYQLETKGDLHEIHLMDNGGAEIPKEYIVSLLTDEKLNYYDKNYTSSKFQFIKVVETKK